MPEEQTNEKKSWEKDAQLAKLYAQLPLWRPLSLRRVALILFFASFFGFTGGVLGALYGSSWLQTVFPSWFAVTRDVPTGFSETIINPSKNENAINVVKPISRQELNEIEKQIHRVALEGEKSVVTIFQKKPRVGNFSKDIYLAMEARGQGSMISSDGWILSTRQVYSARGEYFALTSAQEMYSVERVVFDSVSDAVFMKIKAKNFPVLSFGDSAALSPGETVLTLGSVQGISVSSIQSLRANPSLNTPFESSERLEFYSSLNMGLLAGFEGSPVLTLDGKLAGVFMNISGKAMMMPLLNFQSQMFDVFKNGEVVRAWLGVRFIDLAAIVAPNEVLQDFALPIGTRAGAFLSSDEASDILGVAPKSPAEKAGLKVGDLLLKVNDDPIDLDHPLALLVGEYQPKDSIALTVLRAGVEKIIDVTLETYQIPVPLSPAQQVEQKPKSTPEKKQNKKK